MMTLRILKQCLEVSVEMIIKRTDKKSFRSSKYEYLLNHNQIIIKNRYVSYTMEKTEYVNIVVIDVTTIIHMSRIHNLTNSGFGTHCPVYIFIQ